VSENFSSPSHCSDYLSELSRRGLGSGSHVPTTLFPLVFTGSLEHRSSGQRLPAATTSLLQAPSALCQHRRIRKDRKSGESEIPPAWSNQFPGTHESCGRGDDHAVRLNVLGHQHRGGARRGKGQSGQDPLHRMAGIREEVRQLGG